MPGLLVELDLTGRTAVVVGLGSVGLRKAAQLLSLGARVVAIDPAASPGVLSQVRGLLLRKEPYNADLLRDESLTPIALVIAAATPEVNRAVVQDANQLGLWVNAASEPETGNCTFLATWRSGALAVGVSTGGASPALAKALRERIAHQLGPEPGELASLMAELRPIAMARIALAQNRQLLFRDWAHPRWLDAWTEKGPGEVRLLLLKQIEQFAESSNRIIEPPPGP